MSIDSPCECEHNNPYPLDARLLPSVVLAVSPAGTMDEASSLSACNVEPSTTGTTSFADKVVLVCVPYVWVGPLCGPVLYVGRSPVQVGPTRVRVRVNPHVGLTREGPTRQQTG